MRTTTTFVSGQPSGTGMGDDKRCALMMMLAPLPFAAAALAMDGRIVATNALFETQWGEQAPQTGNRALGEIVAEADLAKLATLFADLTRGEKAGPLTVELRFPAAEGRLRVGLAGFTPYEYEKTPLLLMQIAPLDEQVAREEALRAQEQRAEYALTASKLGVWDHNLKTGVFEFSDLWLSIRGFTSPDQLIHNNEEWINQLHPDDRERTLHAIERQNRGDPDYAVFRYRIRHKNGNWIWIECRGMCVEWDEYGNPLRSTGTDADVTSRQDWEDNMTAQAQRLRLALDVSRIGVFEANLTTGTSNWDERMYAIYGVPVEQEIPVGSAWESMLHPEDKARVLAKMEYHLENLLPHSDEFRVIRADGTIAYIRSRSLPFIEPGTGHRKVIGADWDVSEDVELQKQLRQARDLAEARNVALEAARASIEHNALHDHLTGLPNRRYLDRVLHDEADGGNLSILHIDLDRFKQINDTQGHSVGDAMLKHAAAVLARCARAEDFLARIGGDEFVIVARSKGPQHHLVSLADRIINELRKPISVDGNQCRIGASIGIASRDDASLDARQLLQNADIALYRAKNLGRNRFEVFSSGMQHEIVNAKKVSDEILRALEQSEFVPWYQFQFDARTLDICGAETLARWQHPERGILTPDRFLPIAEDLDAVADIDAQILEKGLIDFRRWQSTGLGIPKISVNVSARRLHDPHLHQTVRELGIQPGTVSFELLESIFLDDFDAAVAENLKNLRRQGIAIEIDDFGSGHASIVSLVRLAPATLKIDRELVTPLSNSQEQRKLVGSIIDIGRSLNIRVVAEGVETAEHIRILRDLGCDALQGYALARPIPASQVEAFVRSDAWRSADPD